MYHKSVRAFCRSINQQKAISLSKGYLPVCLQRKTNILNKNKKRNKYDEIIEIWCKQVIMAQRIPSKPIPFRPWWFLIFLLFFFFWAAAFKAYEFKKFIIEFFLKVCIQGCCWGPRTKDFSLLQWAWRLQCHMNNWDNSKSHPLDEWGFP